jgi:hypothetical protein
MVNTFGSIGILFDAVTFHFESGIAAPDSQSFQPRDEQVGIAWAAKCRRAASCKSLKPNRCSAGPASHCPLSVSSAKLVTPLGAQPVDVLQRAKLVSKVLPESGFDHRSSRAGWVLLRVEIITSRKY